MSLKRPSTHSVRWDLPLARPLQPPPTHPGTTMTMSARLLPISSPRRIYEQDPESPS
jgi:hypothetical protein